MVAVGVAPRFLRRPGNRQRLVEGMERRPALRPLLAAGRRVAPPARFLWGRLTPRPLGLELTTLLAILAVSLYVMIAYTGIVSGDAGPTAGDRTAFDLADHLQASWLVHAAKIVTALGSAAVTLPLAAVAAVALAGRRRWGGATVLVAGLAVGFIGVGEVKAATSRPRPPHRPASAGGA